MSGGATEGAGVMACVVGAIAPDERAGHFALIQELFGTAMREKRPVDGGYEFSFPADAAERVFRFLLNERKCCPFLRFTVELAPHAAGVSLRITGDGPVREFLDAELPIATTA